MPWLSAGLSHSIRSNNAEASIDRRAARGSRQLVEPGLELIPGQEALGYVLA